MRVMLMGRKEERAGANFTGQDGAAMTAVAAQHAIILQDGPRIWWAELAKGCLHEA